MRAFLVGVLLAGFASTPLYAGQGNAIACRTLPPLSHLIAVYMTQGRDAAETLYNKLNAQNEQCWVEKLEKAEAAVSRKIVAVIRGEKSFYAVKY